MLKSYPAQVMVLPLRMKIFSFYRGFCQATNKTLLRGTSGQSTVLSSRKPHPGLWNIPHWSRYISVTSAHPSGYFKKFGQSLALQCRFISEDRETKTLTLWKNIQEVKSSPVPALVLGISGLVPFVMAPTYMTMSMLYMPQVAFAQVAYGAAMLSFIGGVRWGFVIPEESKHKPNWFNLGYSVAPAMVAWVGLLLPDPLTLFAVMGGLVGTAYFDTIIPGYPPWFKGLRFVVSFVAVLSLWTTFMCRILLKTKNVNMVDQNEQ